MPVNHKTNQKFYLLIDVAATAVVEFVPKSIRAMKCLQSIERLISDTLLAIKRSMSVIH